MKFSHIALNCKDLEVTEAFYSKNFGFKRARVIDLGDAKIVFIKRGSIYLELFQAEGEAAGGSEADGPHAPSAVRHIAFQVDDVDATMANIKAEITLGPLGFDDFIPGWRTVWIKDPDGVIVEISQGFYDDPELSL